MSRPKLSVVTSIDFKSPGRTKLSSPSSSRYGDGESGNILVENSSIVPQIGHDRFEGDLQETDRDLAGFQAIFLHIYIGGSQP